jgi:hypothetical protein
VRNGINNKSVPVIASVGNRTDKNGDLTDGQDSCVDGAFDAAATTISDAFALSSNLGRKINILAPGDEILAASNDPDDAKMTGSGSSESTGVVPRRTDTNY